VYSIDSGRSIDGLTDRVLGAQAVSNAGSWNIAVDLCRSGQRYVVNADLPGVDPASIELIVDSGALTIKARRTRRSVQTDDWIVSERISGTFERQLILNEPVDAEHIHVGYHSGVLTVNIPLVAKPSPCQPRCQGRPAHRRHRQQSAQTDPGQEPRAWEHGHAAVSVRLWFRRSAF
jgi:HSP20 family protein